MRIALHQRRAHDITMPGVQNPHCIASCFTKAACTGCSDAPSDNPSIVVTFLSPTSRVNVMQASCGLSSTRRYTPNKRRDRRPPWFRSAPAFPAMWWQACHAGCAVVTCTCPFTCIRTATAPGPSALGVALLTSAVSACACSSRVPAAVSPAPFQKTAPRKLHLFQSDIEEPRRSGSIHAVILRRFRQLNCQRL